MLYMEFFLVIRRRLGCMYAGTFKKTESREVLGRALYLVLKDV